MARKPDLSERIIEEMKTMINTNMKPGDRFPTEGELISILNASRSTVRESLKVLLALGMLTRKGSGMYVSNITNQYLVEPLHVMLGLDVCSISDLLQLRNLMELNVVQLVADDLSEEAIRELEHLAWQMQNPAASDDDFQKIDIRFHQVLAEATGNKILEQLLAALRNVIAETQAKTCKIQPIQEMVINSHKKLIKALAVHDSKKALLYMKEHLEISRTFYGFSSETIQELTQAPTMECEED